MVVLAEKKLDELNSIKINQTPEIAILDIIKNANVVIKDSHILEVSRWVAGNMEDGIPITVTNIGPNGTYDVGELSVLDTNGQGFLGTTPDRPVFSLSKMKRVYRATFGGNAKGYFLMQGRFQAYYLRDY